MQDEKRFTELLAESEELKTLPYGDIWNEYLRRCDTPLGDWLNVVKEYESTVLSKRN